MQHSQVYDTRYGKMRVTADDTAVLSIDFHMTAIPGERSSPSELTDRAAR